MKILKNKNMYTYTYNNCLVTFERIKNDINGHPRYDVVIVDMTLLGDRVTLLNHKIRVTSYNLIDDIKKYIDSLNK